MVGSDNTGWKGMGQSKEYKKKRGKKGDFHLLSLPFFCLSFPHSLLIALINKIYNSSIFVFYNVYDLIYIFKFLLTINKKRLFFTG